MKEIRVCRRCDFEVFPSETEGYSYQCYDHDEDLITAETKMISKAEYHQFLSQHFGCPIEYAERLAERYHDYVTSVQNQGQIMSLQDYWEAHHELIISRM